MKLHYWTLNDWAAMDQPNQNHFWAVLLQLNSTLDLVKPNPILILNQQQKKVGKHNCFTLKTLTNNHKTKQHTHFSKKPKAPIQSNGGLCKAITPSSTTFLIFFLNDPFLQIRLHGFGCKFLCFSSCKQLFRGSLTYGGVLFLAQMKYLEKKQRLERVGGVEKKCISLDVALKDTYFKGSLLDRVASLEHRLFQVQIFLLHNMFFLFHHLSQIISCLNWQLCLEMDSGSSSNPSSLGSTQTSADISSSSPTPKQFCRGEPSSSYPIFHYPSHGGTSKISQIQV